MSEKEPDAVEDDNRPQRRGRRSILGSPIARLILASNLTGLIVLVIGAFVLNEMRSTLVQSRASDLITQGQVITSLLADGATIGSPEPALDEDRARGLLRTLDLPDTMRARVYTPNGEVVADSYFLSEQIDETALPPPGRPGAWSRAMAGLSDWFAGMSGALSPSGASSAIRFQNFDAEFARAARGDANVGQRFSTGGRRIISYSRPVQRVSAIVGILTLEASDAADVVSAERAALLPFILVAVLVALITSVLLTLMIARPLRRLSLAAERVRVGASRHLELPSLSGRKDEIGDLTKSMSAMTAALQERIEANESFAADVAHELKNPLTSIRSAVETAERVRDPEQLERLRQVIAQDVRRLDRLITDISNASRLEAEISRERDARVDVHRLLSDIALSYEHVDDGPDVAVKVAMEPLGGGMVRGLGGPLGQVFRNLLDNARSFSPVGGEVRVSFDRASKDGVDWVRVIVDDDGPGIPVDKLEKVFDRFYTDRPEGTAFGNNSGLGLSIVKQIIHAHRGRVMAENRQAEDGCVEGARFVVELRAG